MSEGVNKLRQSRICVVQVKVKAWSIYYSVSTSSDRAGYPWNRLR